MEIHFDNKSTEDFFQWIAEKVAELSIPIVKQTLESEVEGEILLGRKEICQQVLNCSVDFADKNFLYKPGFPYMMVGSSRKYPKKAVEKWIHENTKFN